MEQARRAGYLGAVILLLDFLIPIRSGNNGIDDVNKLLNFFKVISLISYGLL